MSPSRGLLAQLERKIIVARGTSGIHNYKEAHGRGEIGKTRHSRSGKNLPHGRPKRLFRRDHAQELLQQGMSWRAVARELGVPLTTVRRAMAG